MANLSVDGRDRRGQMILAAAFILAISFVVLALVVNSAIFTENLATRDDVAGSNEALEHRAEVVASVGAVIDAANANASQSRLDASNSVDNISTQSRFDQSALGRMVAVEYVGWEEGMRVAQDNASRNFTSEFDGDPLNVGKSPPDDWTVVEGVSDIRNFQINVSNFEILDLGDPFEVVANDTNSNDEWRLQIAGEAIGVGFGNRLVLRVETPEGDTASCEVEVDGEYGVIDITDATVAGEPCVALDRDQTEESLKYWIAADIDEFNVEFEQSDNIEGTFSFVVDGGASVEHDDHFSTEPSTHRDVPLGPYYQDDDIIYSMTVHYAFYTSQVGYETEIEGIAPGETPP